MADVTLAECNEQCWLVGGEAHIDDLLANTLPPGVNVEVIPCAELAEVRSLWSQLTGKTDRDGDPWLIHPAIARRTRNAVATDHAVFFGQWSAMIDEDALMVIRAAAARARVEQDRPVTIVSYLAPDADRAIADLSSLRAQLIEGRLADEGVDRARIARADRPVADMPGRAPNSSAESQRLDIVIRDVG